jgi:hypothetical protein
VTVLVPIDVAAPYLVEFWRRSHCTIVEFLPFGPDWTHVAEIRFSENKDLPDNSDPPRRQKASADRQSTNRFAVLSLYSIGTAFAQGVPAGTMAPMYGTTWAAARAQAHSLNAQIMASEASKTAPAEAPRAAENKSRADRF